MVQDIYFHKRLIELGINSSNFCYTGPWLVTLDLTNICNNRCQGCWCFSEEILKTKPSFPKDSKNHKYMPYEMVIKTIDELSELGAYSINLSGGGEPLMHPQFKEIFLYLKQKKFEVNLNTNFSLARKEDLDDFLNLRLNHLHLSLWAGDVKTYMVVYPGKKEEDFISLTNHIKYLTGHKYRFPINVYFVISKLNYKNISTFIKYAAELHVDSIEFTIIDIPDESLNHLELGKNELEELFQFFKNCLFDDISIKQLPDGTKINHSLDILNIGILLNRLDNSSLKENTLKLVNSIPCLVGWTYTRIMYDGLVLPCCKAFKNPIGDLYNNSFKDIWYSAKYSEFREKAKNLSKDHPYFAKINCARGCDNYINNIETITNFGKDKYRL